MSILVIILIVVIIIVLIINYTFIDPKLDEEEKKSNNKGLGCCLAIPVFFLILFSCLAYSEYKDKIYFDTHPEASAERDRRIEAERTREEIERASKEFEQQMYNIERDKQEREYKHMQELERNYQRSRR